MKPTVVLMICLAGASGLLANEALDLLEGKISEEDLTLSGLLEDEEREPAAGPEPKQKTEVKTVDYSRRWRRSLPPLVTFETDATEPVVQAVAIDGLAEWGYVTGTIERDGGTPDEDLDDNQLRRLRLGGMIRAFYNTDLEGRVVVDGSGYQGIDTLKATVQVNEGLKVEAGKFRPPFTQEYRRDPEVRIAPGLSPIVAQVAPANTLGVKLTGLSGPWEMGLGWFSGEVDKSLPGFGGSGFILASLAYQFSGLPPESAESTGEEVLSTHQRWYVDYIHNLDDGQPGSVPRGYEHVLATGIEVSSGDFDFSGDFVLANGPVDTAWGMSLMGRYWLLRDALRFVGRYGYADTDDIGGLSVGYGVPNASGDSRQPLAGYSTIQTGDELHSFYGGLDWHVIEDYLMFTTGVEYRVLKNQNADELSSWLWHSGARVVF
ncbi:MAG: hypothetical protein AAGC74_12500 [Verrucomicrobiota bacterium]